MVGSARQPMPPRTMHMQKCRAKNSETRTWSATSMASINTISENKSRATQVQELLNENESINTGQLMRIHPSRWPKRTRSVKRVFETCTLPCPDSSFTAWNAFRQRASRSAWKSADLLELQIRVSSRKFSSFRWDFFILFFPGHILLPLMSRLVHMD